jgi:hypothetical protein
MKGQTPGKKVAKIRVTSVTGEPINFIKSFIRNLVRLVDILPGTYFIGIIVLLFNKRCQRLGDLAANTMVIKVRDSKSFREKVSEILQTDEDNEGEGMISEEKLSGVLIAEENKAEFAVDEKRYRMLKKYLEIRDGFIRKDDYDYLMFRYYNLITGSKVPNNMLPYYRLSFLMDIINQNAPYYD